MADIDTTIVRQAVLILPYLIFPLGGVLVLFVDRYLDEDEKGYLLWVTSLPLVISVLVFWKKFLGGGDLLFGVTVSKLSVFFILVMSLFLLFVVFVLRTGPLFMARDFSHLLFFALFFVIAVATRNFILTGIGLFGMSGLMLLALLGSLDGRSFRGAFSLLALSDFAFAIGTALYFYAVLKFWMLKGSELGNLINTSGAKGVVLLAFAFVIFSFLIKVGIFPLHWWTTSISSVRGRGDMWCAIYRVSSALVMLKFVAPVALIWADPLRAPVLVLACASLIYGASASLTSDELSHFITYLGALFAGLIVLLFMTIPAAPLEVSIVIVFTAIVFGILYMALSGIHSWAVFGDGNRYTPDANWLKAMTTLIFGVLAGAPLSAGFVMRFFVVKNIVAQGLCVTAVTLIAFAIMFASSIRAIWLVYRRGVWFGEEYPGLRVYISIGATSFLLLYIGIWPSRLIELIRLSIAG